MIFCSLSSPVAPRPVIESGRGATGLQEGDAMLPSYCDGLTRRNFLRVGSLGGLSLAQALRMQQAARAEGAAKKDVNCIFIFLIGGSAAHDRWEPKPGAAPGIRRGFKRS